jgi:hypothetical protein
MPLAAKDYEYHSYFHRSNDFVMMKSRQHLNDAVLLHFTYHPQKNDMTIEYDPTNILHYTTMSLNNDYGDFASNISIGIDTDHLT